MNRSQNPTALPEMTMTQGNGSNLPRAMNLAAMTLPARGLPGPSSLQSGLQAGPQAGPPAGSNPTVPSIPSLKRTLSGGSNAGLHAGGHVHSGPNPLAGLNPLSSVLQPAPSTSPPQMLRATTSTGVFNRPMPSVGNPGRPAGSGSTSGSGSSMALASGARSAQSAMQDWRMYMTIEERQAVRAKIRDAYTSRCTTYEELLQVACAIEEELLHISAPSRLDYFKSGFEFENRVKLKKDQLQGQAGARAGAGAGAASTGGADSKRRTSSPPPSSSTSSSSNASSSPATHSKKQRT